MLLPPERRRSLFDYQILAAYLAGTTSGALLTATVAWVLSGFAEPLGEGRRAVCSSLARSSSGCASTGRCRASSLYPSRAKSPRRSSAAVSSAVLTGSGWSWGPGVRTYVPSPAPYILLLAIVLARLTLADAILVGLGFGLGRGVPLMIQLTAASRLRATNPLLRRPAAPATADLLTLAGALILV